MPVPQLNRTEILILSALVPAERYGLEIVDTVKELTEGRVKLSLGGLYTTRHRMEVKTLVAGRWGEATNDRQGARRRYYKVTGLGERALAEATAVLRSALSLVPQFVGRRA